MDQQKQTLRRLQRENFKDSKEFNKSKREAIKYFEEMIKQVKKELWLK